MDLFIDTANVDEIKEINSWGILRGVTTNPTLAAKEGKEFKSLIREITGIVSGPVSAEAVSFKKDEIVEEARELAKIAKNVVIKIPIMGEGLAATSILSKEGIRINTTLVFSSNQALLAAQAGTYFVSPFIGRLDDIGHDGIGIVAEMVEIFRNSNLQAKVLAASIRHPLHVIDAALVGADIATLPYKIFKQMVKHALTDIGIERFLSDFEKIKHL
ncbi:MAG: fructose-6-phosphate aldolase [Actinomycetia bacterium]|nr:fructose-6-phosphate aldolase [Actinomycetes bacterium]